MIWVFLFVNIFRHHLGAWNASTSEPVTSFCSYVYVCLLVWDPSVFQPSKSHRSLMKWNAVYIFCHPLPHLPPSFLLSLTFSAFLSTGSVSLLLAEFFLLVLSAFCQSVHFPILFFVCFLFTLMYLVQYFTLCPTFQKPHTHACGKMTQTSHNHPAAHQPKAFLTCKHLLLTQ